MSHCHIGVVGGKGDAVAGARRQISWVGQLYKVVNLLIVDRHEWRIDMSHRHQRQHLKCGKRRRHHFAPCTHAMRNTAVPGAERILRIHIQHATRHDDGHQVGAVGQRLPHHGRRAVEDLPIGVLMRVAAIGY